MVRSIPPVFCVALALCLAAGACAGGNQAGSNLEATVAESLAAQKDFREIYRHWVESRPSDRGKLEPLLVTFIRQHASDRRVRMARVYLAWIYVQRGRVDDARRLVQETRSGPSGSARDFAVVAEAAILLREGKPDRAESALRPLDGKLIDPEERFLYGEQRVLAALAAHRDADAIEFMQNWLVQVAPDDRILVQARVQDMLGEIAGEPLEHWALGPASNLERQGNPDVAQARHWLLDKVADRLVHVALERNDGELARRLLDSGVEPFRHGDRGTRLARIAAAGSVIPRVSGRAVGFVLSSGSADLRRRSAQVIAGMSRALGLPASAANHEAVQLVTSEDSGEKGGLEHALAELAGEGAVILVAGLDADSAARARRYSRDAKIPVILLYFTQLGADDHAFELGVDPELEATTLNRELSSAGAKSVVRVGAGGVACDVRAPSAGLPRFPVADWKRDGVDAIEILGDTFCARDAARELVAVGSRPVVGLGLEAAEAVDALDVGTRRVALAAGSFPYQGGSAAPDDLQRFVKQAGRNPSWYASLGHDAAALAREALAGFALERVDDARLVAKLHEDAEHRLASAHAELWSSSEKGFSRGRTLQRTLGSVKGKQ